jgi:hypothetical protein
MGFNSGLKGLMFHHNGNLITEQGTGEQNLLFQLAIDTMLTSATT